MSWFSRRKPKGEYAEKAGITDGIHRSPGLAVLSEELEKRRVEAILDLGASHNENLAYLSQFSENISIRDVVGTSGEASARPRASLFQLDVDVLSAEDGTAFDVVLLWDLLHYVDRSQRASFVTRLGALCRRDALVLALTAGSAPIPLMPIRIKIHDRDHLHYEVVGERWGEAPHFTPREVEQLMKNFAPVRYFQLRNGLQEFVFRYEGGDESADSASPPSEQPGDWY